MGENLRHAIAYEKLLSEKEALEAERDQFKEAFKKQCLFSAELESHLAETEKVLTTRLLSMSDEVRYEEMIENALKALRGEAKE